MSCTQDKCKCGTICGMVGCPTQKEEVEYWVRTRTGISKEVNENMTNYPHTRLVDWLLLCLWHSPERGMADGLWWVATKGNYKAERPVRMSWQTVKSSSWLNNLFEWQQRQTDRQIERRTHSTSISYHSWYLNPPPPTPSGGWHFYIVLSLSLSLSL